MKHTRGEWEIHVGNYPNSYFLQTVVEDVESEANAKLMSAAPELLEALQLINDSGCMLSDYLTDKMLNAIKKATE